MVDFDLTFPSSFLLGTLYSTHDDDVEINIIMQTGCKKKSVWYSSGTLKEWNGGLKKYFWLSSLFPDLRRMYVYVHVECICVCWTLCDLRMFFISLYACFCISMILMWCCWEEGEEREKERQYLELSHFLIAICRCCLVFLFNINIWLETM